MFSLFEHKLFESKWTFFALFIGIFVIEASLSFWTELPYDTEIWFNTGVWMNQGINIYEPPHHLGYPPLWALWCLIAYNFYSMSGNNYELWRFVIKLPMILAHLGLAFSVAKFSYRRFNKKTGVKIFVITLIWSYFIFIGALWGQINTLSALLTFLAFFAITKDKTITSAFLMGTAITLKIYPIVVLPAFFAYIIKNKDRLNGIKFLVYCLAIPIIFTGIIFTVLQWDITFFLKTVFYSTPVFENNPVQIIGGAMNIWSFFALLSVDTVKYWFLRLIWVPVLGIGSLYWLRKKKLDDNDLNFSIISLYLLFMISYGWVSEQSFLDPLPFILLLIIGYRPKRLHLYILSLIQLLVYAFSTVNWGPFIFEPLAERFFPMLLPLIWGLDPSKSTLIWYIRGTLGLIISISLASLLIILSDPQNLFQNLNKILTKLRFKTKSLHFTYI